MCNFAAKRTMKYAIWIRITIYLLAIVGTGAPNTLEFCN